MAKPRTSFQEMQQEILHGKYRGTPQTPYGGPTQATNPSAGTGADASAGADAGADAGAGVELTPAQLQSLAAALKKSVMISWTRINGQPAPRTPLPLYTRPPVESADVIVGEIIAWRVWLIQEPDLLLRSTYMPTPWPSGEHVVGDVKGGFGVHAWKGRETAIDYASEELMYLRSFDERRNRQTCLALGQVALWGTVDEHERGWCGEFAKVHSIEQVLAYRPVAGHLLACLRHRYCPQQENIARRAPWSF